MAFRKIRGPVIYSVGQRYYHGRIQTFKNSEHSLPLKFSGSVMNFQDNGFSVRGLKGSREGTNRISIGHCVVLNTSKRFLVRTH